MGTAYHMTWWSTRIITEYGSHGQIMGPKLCFACKHPDKCTILELVVCLYFMITCAVYFVRDLERTVTHISTAPEFG